MKHSYIKSNTCTVLQNISIIYQNWINRKFFSFAMRIIIIFFANNKLAKIINDTTLLMLLIGTKSNSGVI